ncbi:MAG: gliding motility protein GldM [Proteiniphilum sp.]|nr:gliding motility protein GldM [Proteiniphilum sp.]
MAVNSPNSPRQKMINLMYLVFIAMLALNVSVEVLDGFGVVEERLGDSSQTMEERNRQLMEELAAYQTANPEKAGTWYDKGVQVRSLSDSLTHYIRGLKLQMVREADGKRGDIRRIRHKEDLEAASVVMLSPLRGEGKKLRSAIDSYRTQLINYVEDPSRSALITRNLSTETRSGGRSWEASLFEQMPLAAAVTLLTKIENDVRLSEGEALASLLQSVDAGDYRLNRLNAWLIPESEMVLQGGVYRARVILAAEDTTRQPRIVVQGEPLEITGDGSFTLAAPRSGTFPVEGYVELTGNDGNITRRNFHSSYRVIEPMATVAPTLMNVLYAGIDNEISISVPGVAPQEVHAVMSNGTLSRHGNLWVARPASAGNEAVITVSASTTGGEARKVATHSFRVRTLPDPTPYIEYRDAGGNPVMRKGGGIPKAALLQSEGVKAAIDDGILHVPFRVTSFRTILFDAMGNAIPEVSDGNRFSERQKEQIRRLTRGSYFYISGIRAAGPDGTEREIAVMELRVN